jgi:hypothetical protein
VLATPLAAMNGTPLPIALNILDKVMPWGKENFFGNDWSASASATEILLFS